MRSRRLLISGTAVLAAVAVLALLVYAVSSHTDTASINAEVASGHFPVAPNYTADLPVLGSTRSTSLSAFRGRVVLVNVYASWCEPCQAEAPLMAHEDTVLGRHHAALVGVTYQDDSSSSEAFDRHYGLRYPVLRDVNGTLVHGLGTVGVPETFVLSPDGRILALERGPVTQAWLNETLDPIFRRYA